MAINFNVTTTLPATGCTQQNVYDTIESIKPVPALVEPTGLQVLADKLALANGVGYWRKVTKTFTDFSAAATTNDIEFLSLPAGGVIHMIKVKHSVAFTGGAISAYTLSFGINGNLVKYLAAASVFTAPSATDFRLYATPVQENHGAAVSIRAAAISTGANLSAATAGSVDIWTYYSVAI